VSLWPSPPLLACPNTGHDEWFAEPPCPWRWPAALWQSVIDAYTLPGDHVLIADAGPGWPAVSATVWRGRSLAARIPDPFDRAAARLERWQLPRWLRRDAVIFGAGGQDPAAWPARARRVPADLLVIPPPCPGRPQPISDDDPPRRHLPPSGEDWALAWQRQALTGSAAAVRPGGVVVVLTRNTPRPDGMVDRVGPLTAHARALGLTYLQHNVVLHADIHDGRLHPLPGPDDRAWGLDLATTDGFSHWARLTTAETTVGGRPGPCPDPLPHMPVHSDLLAYLVPGAAQ
jgi:hypothetical protein